MNFLNGNFFVVKYLELSPRADADRSETKKPPRSLSDKSECRISSASNSADVLTGVTLQSPESKGASIQHTLPENDEGGDPQFSFSNQFFCKLLK